MDTATAGDQLRAALVEDFASAVRPALRCIQVTLATVRLCPARERLDGWESVLGDLVEAHDQLRAVLGEWLGLASLDDVVELDSEAGIIAREALLAMAWLREEAGGEPGSLRDGARTALRMW